MPPIDDVIRIAHSLGDLSPGQSEAVEQAAHDDPDLAAELEVLRALVEVGKVVPPVGRDEIAAPSPLTTQPRRSWFHRHATLLAASAAAVLLLCGATFTGYTLLREKPLVEDDFRDEWLNTSVWDTHRGRKGVREEGGHLRLLNRGSIVTMVECPPPYEVELDWQWINLEGDTLHPDVFVVCLRTAGKHDPNHPFEPDDGVHVAFDPHLGGVKFVENNEVKKQTERTVLPLAAGKWYHLRLQDDGQRIRVFVSGPNIDRKYEKESVIEYEDNAAAKDHRVAFFNREYVAKANHESRIDNVVIRRLRAE